jgi:hypothetical protein
MPYTVTSDTLGLAIGPMAETTNEVHEALSKARRMYETGLANVSITDQAGAQNRWRRFAGLYNGEKDYHQRPSGKVEN